MRIYRNKAFKYLPPYCAFCFSVKNLSVHHKDNNEKNNELNNLIILCRECHDELHTPLNKKMKRKNKK